jgi:tRNA G46 methylase TrmB
MTKPRDTSEIMREPIVRQTHRVLSQDEVFLFITDAQEYFNKKVEMVSDLQIFRIKQITQAMEDPVTRYQKQWQSKGIYSNRAEFVKK